ncbi:MAG: hypothetical protein IJV20_05825 [Prevotella sp.]|nr:hypothetical protein [Prevotella sp.]
MRFVRSILAVLMISIFPISVCAQITTRQVTQFEKDAKKEAKVLKKEGWKVPAGSFSIERQLTQAYQLQSEVDMDRQPKYNFGQAISRGSFYDAAKMQAVELAKADLAGNILTDLTTIVSTKLENRQISSDKANSASEIIREGEAVVSQKLDSPIQLVEIYRTLKDGTVEVQIRLAYDKEKGIRKGLDALSLEFEKEGVEL